MRRKYKEKKPFYKRGGFYVLIIILLWMLISVVKPIEGKSDSFTKPVHKELFCRLQMCQYKEYEMCANNDDFLYPYPKNQVNYQYNYPKVSIDKLPNEMVYCCDCFDPNAQEFTKKDLVNGTFCYFSSGYSGTGLHNKYGGYFIKNDLIYREDKLCGPIGKIRYKSICKC